MIWIAIGALALALLASPEPSSPQPPQQPDRVDAPSTQSTDRPEQGSPDPPGASDATAASPSEKPPEVTPQPPPEVMREIEKTRAAEEKARQLRDRAQSKPEDLPSQVEWMQGLLDLGFVDEILDIGPLLVERFPKSVDLLIVLGRAQIRDGLFDLGLLQFQRALAIDGSSALAHELTGLTRAIRGDRKSAEASLRKALAIEPRMKEARALLVVLLERGGRYAEALEIAEKGGIELTGKRKLLKEFARKPPMILPKQFSTLSIPLVVAGDFPPFLSIKAGGKEHLFVIDTATEEMVITPEAARELGLPEKGQEITRDDDGRFYLTPVYTLLDEIQIGELAVKRVPARVLPGLHYPDPRIAGVIARDFLRHFRVVIDYPAQTLTLSRPDKGALKGTPFDLASVMLLEGSNGDRELGKFVFDTSSYTPGAMDAKFVAQETGLSIFSPEVKQLEAGSYLFSFTMPNLEVAGVRFTSFPATAVDLRSMSRQIGVNVRGVVGYTLVRDCRVEIDFENQRISINRQKPKAEVSDPRR